MHAFTVKVVYIQSSAPSLIDMSIGLPQSYTLTLQQQLKSLFPVQIRSLVLKHNSAPEFWHSRFGVATQWVFSPRITGSDFHSPPDIHVDAFVNSLFSTCHNCSKSQPPVLLVSVKCVVHFKLFIVCIYRNVCSNNNEWMTTLVRRTLLSTVSHL